MSYSGTTMELTETIKDDVMCFKLSGRLDTHGLSVFESHMKEWLDEGFCRFIGDFTDLEFISSAGLRLMLTLVKKVRSVNCRICLVSVRPKIQEVLNVTGINVLFDYSESVDEAFALFAQKDS